MKLNQLRQIIREELKEQTLNEDNLEIKSIAKKLYSFLKQNSVNAKLVAQTPNTSYGKQIGATLKGGSNEALISYYDDPKTKQTVIEIHLAGEEKGVLEIEKKLLSSFPNLEQYNRQTPSGPGIFRVVFRVKEKTTAKGGMVGNTQQKTNESFKMKKLELRQIIREELKKVDSSERMFPSYNQILAKGVEGGSTMPKTYFDNKTNIKDMVNRIIKHVANDSKANAERDLRMLKGMLKGMVEKL